MKIFAFLLAAELPPEGLQEEAPKFVNMTTLTQQFPELSDRLLPGILSNFMICFWDKNYKNIVLQYSDGPLVNDITQEFIEYLQQDLTGK